MSDIYRTPNQGCFQIENNTAWHCSRLVPATDPLADITEDDVKELFIFESFPRINHQLWLAIVDLYFYLAKSKSFSSLEVSVVLLRNENNPDEWRVVVPTQKVTVASVNASFEKCCDILTGEELTWPIENYAHAGSSHSHHTLTLDTFSSVDDANELSVPGLHLLSSCLNLATNSYKITPSLVRGKQRYFINSASTVIDLPESRNNLYIHPYNPSRPLFHSKVLKYVQENNYSTLTPTKSKQSAVFSKKYDNAFSWGLPPNTNNLFMGDDINLRLLDDFEFLVCEMLERGYSAQELINYISSLS